MERFSQWCNERRFVAPWRGPNPHWEGRLDRADYLPF